MAKPRAKPVPSRAAKRGGAAVASSSSPKGASRRPAHPAPAASCNSASKATNAAVRALRGPPSVPSGSAASRGSAAPPTSAKAPPASHCAPARYRMSRVTGSCLTPAEVVEVAKVMHLPVPAASAPAAPSPSPSPSAREVGMVRQLLTRVHAVAGTRPGEEHRWLALQPVQQRPGLRSKLDAAFRPPQPASWAKEPHAWLSSVDIEQVMRQYEQSHGLRFVGVFPRDFATTTAGGYCVSQPMCDLTVQGLREGAHRKGAGMVFNMDLHTQSGSHWAACYVGVNPRQRERFGVWYYDSVARPPPTEIAAFMHRMRDEALAAFGPRVGARFQVRHNTVRRQFENTECGIYACLFLVACISTTCPFQAICSRIMRDDATMSRLRHVFFR